MTDGNNGQLRDWRLAQAEERIGKLAQHISELEIKYENRERERAAEERKRLWWGITTLGGIVITLLGTIWSLRHAIFPGTGP